MAAAFDTFVSFTTGQIVLAAAVAVLGVGPTFPASRSAIGCCPCQSSRASCPIILIQAESCRRSAMASQVKRPCRWLPFVWMRDLLGGSDDEKGFWEHARV